MQLTAKLIELHPVQTGTGKNGEWKKQTIIVETEGQYPKKVCVTIWGDKTNSSHFQIGKNLTIDFDLESREFNGRWYTDVKAWKVEASGGQETSEIPSPSGDYGFPPPPPLPAPLPADEPQDDLPF
jgi:hypothetical protein